MNMTTNEFYEVTLIVDGLGMLQNCLVGTRELGYHEVNNIMDNYVGPKGVVALDRMELNKNGYYSVAEHILFGQVGK